MRGDEQSTAVGNASTAAAAARTRWFRRRLLAWFACSGRTFPWRDPTRTPYEVVVAEILLQRTTAACVARAYPTFIERYPTWRALSHAPPGQSHLNKLIMEK